jgi:hypothetical protein
VASPGTSGAGAAARSARSARNDRTSWPRRNLPLGIRASTCPAARFHAGRRSATPVTTTWRTPVSRRTLSRWPKLVSMQMAVWVPLSPAMYLRSGGP